MRIDYFELVYSELLFTDISRWWYNEHEVDVVGLANGGSMVTDKSNFTASPLNYSALNSLEEHIEQIRWAPDGTAVDHKHALFARNGFTQSVTEAAATRDDLQLVTIDQIVDSPKSG